ncbi:MAG: hypothetical protein KC478_09985 [Bacteriovoracaceae bacterium]|nr:hypothetical protein [Bacteriovoracaceae bacterium]
MNLGKVVMTTAVALMPTVLFAGQNQTVPGSHGPHQHHEHRYSRWCNDVSYILQVSLDSAYHATTFEQERSILVTAINKTLEKVNPKYHFYFETTLTLALKIEKNLGTDKERVFFLRRSITTALADLKDFDTYSRSQDYAAYVEELLRRAITEGLRVETEKLELLILNTSMSNAISVLRMSDYRRTASHACASAYLKEAQTFEDVFYKRNLIQKAIDSLSYGCHY